MIEGAAGEALKHTEAAKDYRLANFALREDDFQTIKVQLRALGLVAKSTKPRSLKDTETYWTLTPHGDRVMTQLRAVRREAVKPKD